MADVTNRIEAADRGQLLLITALALAVILVTVALLLNAAVFTENVATRETATEGGEALAFRAELVDGIGGLIETENRRANGSMANVTDGINATIPLVDRQHARYGTVGRLRLNGTTDGRLLRRDSDATFTDGGGDADWRLVGSLDTVRNFSLRLTSLPSDPAVVEDDAFGVRFVNESAGNVTQYLYVDGGDVVVDEANESHGPTRQCAIPQTPSTTVDLTGDRLSTATDSVGCFRGLWPPHKPTAVEFVNGDTAAGTFELTVGDGASPTTDTTVENDPAVYSATVDIVYRTPDLTFETRVHIAPGEPR